MTKNEIVRSIHEDTGFHKEKVRLILNTIDDQIIDSMKEGKTIELSDLGTFWMKNRKAKNGVNPVTREKMFIPEKFIVAFTASPVAKAIAKEYKFPEDK